MLKRSNILALTHSDSLKRKFYTSIVCDQAWGSVVVKALRY